MLSGRIFGKAVLLFALTMTLAGGLEMFQAPGAKAVKCYTSDGITSCIGDIAPPSPVPERGSDGRVP